MRKLLAIGTLALLSAVPLGTAAQANEINQDMVRPGVFGPGVSGITADGQVVPGGDAEAKQTGPDGNVSQRFWIPSQAYSGSSGMDTQVYSSSPGYAIDPHSAYDNHNMLSR